MKLIVGVGPNVPPEQAEEAKDDLAAMGIDAVIISHCTALAVVEVEQVMP